jgi:hypothetical protein
MGEIVGYNERRATLGTRKTFETFYKEEALHSEQIFPECGRKVPYVQEAQDRSSALCLRQIMI